VEVPGVAGPALLLGAFDRAIEPRAHELTMGSRHQLQALPQELDANQPVTKCDRHVVPVAFAPRRELCEHQVVWLDAPPRACPGAWDREWRVDTDEPRLPSGRRVRTAQLRRSPDEELGKAPPRRGLSVSGPVSRILSWATIYLGPALPRELNAAYPGLGGPRHRPCLALHRVGFA
jgi:hypothetical protein